MANNFISEFDIEQSLLQRLQHLNGFDVLDCNTAKPDDLNDGSNRSDKRDVILVDRLREACIALNPAIPPEVIDHKKVVFTLIQKFRYDKGKQYPRLFDPQAEKREVVVIVDEAHRTQYKFLAENMRAGLKGAHFLAFTGTPLLGKERKTSAWFGGYVSEYNFQQAMDDGATVPLFYEKRVPEVLIQNESPYNLFIGRTDKLEKQKREKETLNHFSDIHFDFPLNDTTRPLLEHFTKYGYSYLSYLDGKVEFASITSQFKNANDYKKIQEHLIHLNSLAALSYISELRNERLIDCKVFNGFEALPLTIGLSSLIP